MIEWGSWIDLGYTETQVLPVLLRLCTCVIFMSVFVIQIWSGWQKSCVRFCHRISYIFETYIGVYPVGLPAYIRPIQVLRRPISGLFWPIQGLGMPILVPNQEVLRPIQGVWRSILRPFGPILELQGPILGPIQKYPKNALPLHMYRYTALKGLT